MAKVELRLPKMGESVAEATITSWLKEVGETIELDEAVLEIATDKVDSEVASEVEGVLLEKRFAVDDVAQVGDVLAIIETGQEEAPVSSYRKPEPLNIPEENTMSQINKGIETIKKSIESPIPTSSSNQRFYSPLVKNIAQEEGITQSELDAIPGTGKGSRVTKTDILSYLKRRTTYKVNTQVEAPSKNLKKKEATKAAPIVIDGDDEVIEMTRMGKIISQHMINSIQTSAHVQSFIEVDVTNVWNWRNKIKGLFEAQEGEKLTFTPIFMQVVAKALRDYPMMNVVLEDDKIIKRKHVNLGMATALPDGNLIVPVVKNADQLNLVGMTKQVNDLSNRARNNELKPQDIKNGTYTVTNVGSFGTLMGTPIINQPQVGILAIGAIRKMPAVIETPEGDFIGIRHKMFLSHSYDHRVVNGALGSMFIKAIKDYLEDWNIHREI